MFALHAIFLGIVEGLTEFLPISSTFHLIFASTLINLEQTEFLKVFEVFVQSGAIMAVLLLYGKEVLTNVKLQRTVLISFIPTAVVGFFLHKLIKSFFFESEWLMLSAFIGIGILFVVYEVWMKRHPTYLRRSLTDLSAKDALIIGLGQALAVLPGVSRAGAVMLTMMTLRVHRDEAAKYSFLLAVPTIFGAAAFDIVKLQAASTISEQQLILLGLGFVAAFGAALIVLRWFIRYLQHHTLIGFGIYRVVTGVLLALSVL